MNKCTICDCDFSEDDGVTGTLGVIEVMFCNYCLVALEDMLEQKKEWIGLTRSEVLDIVDSTSHPLEFYRSIEAKLKEKNGF